MPMHPSLTYLPVIGSHDSMLLLLAGKYLITMAWILWESWKKLLAHSPHFLMPYDYVARRLPRPHDTFILAVHGAFCITIFMEISVRQLCFKLKYFVTYIILEKILPF